MFSSVPGFVAGVPAKKRAKLHEFEKKIITFWKPGFIFTLLMTQSQTPFFGRENFSLPFAFFAQMLGVETGMVFGFRLRDFPPLRK